MKTTNHTLAVALVLAAAFSTACGTTESKDGITKSAAQQLAPGEWPEDYCESEGWYSDGVCDDFCPEVDDDCVSDVDCQCDVAPAIAMICPDGSVGSYFCGVNEAGVCDSGFDCEPVDPCECGPAPQSAWMCEDGSTGVFECTQAADGTCGYEPTCDPAGGPTDPPTDPGDLCDTCEGPIPAIALMCEDGSTAETVCRTRAEGPCGYQFECPE